MEYATMLKKAIAKSNISLMQVTFRLAKKDICLDKAVLSKMQNGKLPPAKDDVNIALAEVLGLDSKRFRIAAVKAVLPEDLIKLIKEDDRAKEGEE